ncbi:hypothetical protein [Wenjunlia vitaminophila]|uniref:hypothetical protein n=1 Tax=Wenjunlia vitaminophila TaxID=76728 RepID=UPI0003AAC1FB|nr:hypothetical protein [Wenjunlia vitaminophila]
MYLINWAAANPWPAAACLAGVVLLALVVALAATRAPRPPARAARRRPPDAVVAAAIAAAACTAYSGDTSWRFAAHRLDMASVTERAAMFAAGELALFACALMARQNLRTTGAPGAPGLLVWVIVGVQIVPAFAESGLVGGFVRAFFGPIAAGLLWHLAMGIELRHHRPGATSQALAAILAREARERLLSRLGVARRGRDAEQITRDRWTVRAVDLAARLAQPGTRPRRARRLEHRLSVAVGRAAVGAHPAQRQALLELLAARRHATALATITLPSPWDAPAPDHAAGRTLAGLVHTELTALDPMDAVHLVADAHPDASPAELASLLTEHGVVVSPTQVAIALRAAAHHAPEPAPKIAASAPRALGCESDPGQHRSAVRATWTPHTGDTTEPHLAGTGPDATECVPAPQHDDPLLPDARAIDDASRATTGRTASLRRLQTELRIGQARAQRIRRALDAPDAPDAPTSPTAPALEE